MMKIFGFNEETTEPIGLNQVTLEADVDTLKKLSGFFLMCAKEMEADDEWSHEHFCDFLGEVLSADVVVFKQD
jgi:hypothetical protein